ncbi:MAG: methyl-accepting chemotaxis protein [Telluria sp.]
MLRNITIKSRLVFVIGFMSLLLVAGGVIGLTSLYFANNSLKDNYEHRLVPITQLDRFVVLVERTRLAVAEAAQDGDAAGALLDEAEKSIGAIDQVWNGYLAAPLLPEERRLADALAVHYRAYAADGLKPAIAALRAQQPAEARALMRGRMRELDAPVRDGINALMQFEVQVARSDFERNQAIYRVVFISCSSGILLGVLLSTAIGVWLVRGISGPLGQAVRVAKGVAAGDLTQRIVVASRDETGQLMQALQEMNAALVKIVTEVRTGADTIASASGQIASGNRDLAARTEQQASSLEQTASSMEELTATVKQNADSAWQASHQIASASQVAVQGGEAVARVVHTMGSINDSAKRIVDIIGVIDSIAFQTNILALNAAVEAARAGEQGRGFAVVAGEVRHLAQRSAAAAKEIKLLIGDSVQKVEDGARLVDEAGTTMTAIVGSVNGATQLMNEIATASREQTAGIEQVNRAIGHMDAVTQQNANLVEQAASAAAALEQQARKLSGVVSVFKLEMQEPAQPVRLRAVAATRVQPRLAQPAERAA